MEHDEMGIIIVTPITQQIIVWTALGFVDDTDFFSNNNNAQSKIQKTMMKYVHNYEATAGKVKQESIVCYSWRWITVDGIKIIENIENVLFIKGHRVKQKGIHEDIRTLGVWFKPDLLWNSEFKQMRRKMMDSVKKLMSTSIQSHLLYNTTIVI